MKVTADRPQPYSQAYFSTLAEAYRADTAWKRNRIRNVLELIAVRPGERVLDLGTGIGTFVIEGTRMGAWAVGVDRSPEALRAAWELLRETGSSTGTLVAGDVAQLPVRSESLDAIICADLVEHLLDGDLNRLLRECWRVLRAGGRVAIYTPCRTHLFEFMMRHNLLLKRDESHIGLRTEREVTRRVRAEGFTIAWSYFRPSHAPVFRSLERILSPLPLLGRPFRRRICLLAIKEPVRGPQLGAGRSGAR